MLAFLYIAGYIAAGFIILAILFMISPWLAVAAAIYLWWREFFRY